METEIAIGLSRGGGSPVDYMVLTSTGLTVSGTIGLWSRTKAQIDAITPTAVGSVLFCSNCTIPDVCVSTGTTLSGFKKIGETAGCGTNN